LAGISVNNKYDALAALLERFSWLADSLIHSVQFEGNLRYEMQITLLLRAMDRNDGFADKTLTLALSGVSEFRVAQAFSDAVFETSSGAAIARVGERLFLELGSSGNFVDSNAPVELTTGPIPRHRLVNEVRKSDFYMDFTDFSAEVLPSR